MMSQTERGLDRRSLMFAIGSILVGVALILTVPPLRHGVALALHGDLTGMRRHFRGLGAGGVLLLLGLMLAHAVVFYPTEIVTATAGFVYGFGPGAALASVGWLLSGLCAYYLGHALARRVLLVIFGARRFGGLERAIERGGVPLLLSARLVPVVPFSLFCYAAGAALVPLWRFAWTTFVGYLPLTLAVAYLGSQARSLSASDPVVWLIAVLVIALLAASHLLGVRRRYR